MKFLIALLLLFSSPSFGATSFSGEITVVNDTSYILTAAVYSASGDFLGQITLQPGEQNNFSTALRTTNLNRPGYPNLSTTPYRVVWQCAGGDVYSVCGMVSVGAYVSASQGDGAHICTPKKEQQKTPATTSASASKKF